MAILWCIYAVLGSATSYSAFMGLDHLSDPGCFCHNCRYYNTRKSSSTNIYFEGRNCCKHSIGHSYCSDSSLSIPEDSGKGLTLKELTKSRSKIESLRLTKRQEKAIRQLLSMGYRLVDIEPLAPQLRETNLLGEGGYGDVYIINLEDVPYPLCLKLIKVNHALDCTLHEANALAFMRRVRKLPRLVAISADPPAIIMSMHGKLTLS